MLNLDTHILLFALQKTLRPAEERLLSRHEWSISAIVLWEIAKLVQLNRIDLDIESPEFTRFVSRLHVWPLTLEICSAIRRLDFRGDPADEIIAATSLVHHVPLLTRDQRIRESKIIRLA